MKTTAILILLTLLACSNSASAQKKKKKIEIDTTMCMEHDTTVQIVVEKNALFQDGDLNNFNRYVAMNLKYPISAIEYKHQGTSYIKFVVNWDGQVKDVTVFKSSEYKTLDKEAVRVVKPGKLNE